MPSKLGEIGESILDFVDVTIDSVTSNIQTSADEKEAKVKILDAAAERIKTEAEIKRKREENLMLILKIFVYVMLTIIALQILGRTILPLFIKK